MHTPIFLLRCIGNRGTDLIFPELQLRHDSVNGGETFLNTLPVDLDAITMHGIVAPSHSRQAQPKVRRDDAGRVEVS